jgi:hypothetical protein
MFSTVIMARNIVLLWISQSAHPQATYLFFTTYYILSFLYSEGLIFGQSCHNKKTDHEDRSFY